MGMRFFYHHQFLIVPRASAFAWRTCATHSLLLHRLLYVDWCIGNWLDRIDTRKARTMQYYMWWLLSGIESRLFDVKEWRKAYFFWQFFCMTCHPSYVLVECKVLLGTYHCSVYASRFIIYRGLFLLWFVTVWPLIAVTEVLIWMSFKIISDIIFLIMNFCVCIFIYGNASLVRYDSRRNS